MEPDQRVLYLVIQDRVALIYPERRFELDERNSICLTIELGSEGVKMVTTEYRYTGHDGTRATVFQHLGEYVHRAFAGGVDDFNLWVRLGAGYQYFRSAPDYRAIMDKLQELFIFQDLPDEVMFRDWIIVGVSAALVAVALTKKDVEEIGRPFEPYGIEPIMTGSGSIDLVNKFALESFSYYAQASEMMGHRSPGIVLLSLVSMLRHDFIFLVDQGDLLSGSRGDRDGAILELFRSIQSTSGDMILTAANLYQQARTMLEEVEAVKNVINTRADEIAERAEVRVRRLAGMLFGASMRSIEVINAEREKALEQVQETRDAGVRDLHSLSGNELVREMIETERDRQIEEAERHLEIIANETETARKAFQSQFEDDIRTAVGDARDVVRARSIAALADVEADVNRKAKEIGETVGQSLDILVRAVGKAEEISREAETREGQFGSRVEDLEEQLEEREKVIRELKKEQEALANQLFSATQTTRMIDSRMRGAQMVRSQADDAVRQLGTLRDEAVREFESTRSETFRLLGEIVERMEERMEEHEQGCQQILTYCKNLEERTFQAAQRASGNAEQVDKVVNEVRDIRQDAGNEARKQLNQYRVAFDERIQEVEGKFQGLESRVGASSCCGASIAARSDLEALLASQDGMSLDDPAGPLEEDGSRTSTPSFEEVERRYSADVRELRYFESADQEALRRQCQAMYGLTSEGNEYSQIGVQIGVQISPGESETASEAVSEEVVDTARTDSSIVGRKLETWVEATAGINGTPH